MSPLVRALLQELLADPDGLRELADALGAYLPTPAPAEPDQWMSTREAATYAGCSVNSLHRAMAEREVHFEQDVPGGKAWFRRADIDAWRCGERPASRKVA